MLFVLNICAQTENYNITVKEEKDPMEGFNEAVAEKRQEYRELQKEVGIKYLGDGEYKMIKESNPFTLAKRHIHV